ncbi:DgyrCDS4617 [Dimorphilus gyrociliatus]|uniref:Mannosyltransferase n=1 Tax=Dimorphilus gyrociliatus TaxID=2664684 RepID=A0A7I8VM62_9ANNE|nr:DgyrCDS4617 [Dimorphilus gyrociliatus]
MPKESKSSATIRRRKRKSVGIHTPSGKKDQPDEPYDSNFEDVEVKTEPMTSGPLALQRLFKSEWTLFLGLLAFRCINALMIQTFYVPDEYWQSLEVSHNMAFGYGYLTWEWKAGLRGYSYPTLFAALYKILAIFKLDYRIFLIKLPRILQAIFAALCDLYLYKFSSKIANQNVAKWSLLCQLTCWFTFYCYTRTLTNSMETVLSTMALFYFPWPGKPKKAHWKYLTLVGMAIVIRPTAAIMWAPLVLWHFFFNRSVVFRILKTFAERVFIVLTLSSIVDRIFYGKWENVQYNFLKQNVLNNIGSFYGSHSWHWYITQGLPVVLGSQTIALVLGLRKCQERICIFLVVWTIFILSLLDHKEFRFLLPIVPLSMHICASYLNQLTENTSEKDDNKSVKSKYSTTQLIVIFLIATNLPIALYTCLLHQRGTIDVMKFISNDNQKTLNDTRVLFLMPCHSTPYYSYMHRNISMRFLTCEPNLTGISNYTDEAEIFYQNPISWISENLNTTENEHMPTHLIMFSTLERVIFNSISQLSFKKCAKFFHSHFAEGRVGKYVVVYCKN